MQQVRSASKKARLLLIQQGAERLLRTRSIYDITMEEFAKEAGVGEATLFRYVGTKDALLLLVYGDRMDQLLTDIEVADVRADMELPPGDKTSEHFYNRILEIYRSRCSFYLENPENSALYLRAGFDMENVNRWRNIAQGDRSILLCKSILDNAREEGVLSSEVSLMAVAENCHAVYMHEIDRTPIRQLDPSTIWERVEPRLKAQLIPLFQHHRSHE